MVSKSSHASLGLLPLDIWMFSFYCTLPHSCFLPCVSVCLRVEAFLMYLGVLVCLPLFICSWLGLTNPGSQCRAILLDCLVGFLDIIGFGSSCWTGPEKAMAPHSSTLAWKIPWMEEPGGLQFMRSLRVGHDWATSLSLFTLMHWRRKWQPTPVFLPWESQGRGSLVGCHLWGHTESDTTEVT